MANTPVRQYIGARYVPVVADPEEWDNQRTYDPLTIVIHQGNSYTSRQYVPVGIDINNTDYWAVTGNYNAQIEQYRKDTQNALTLAQTIKSDVYTKTESDLKFGRKPYNILDYITGDDETQDVTSQIQAALNNEDITGLYFPARQYVISETLTINLTRSRPRFAITAADGATFKPIKPMTAVFNQISDKQHVQWEKTQFIWYGGIIDGNWNAKYGIQSNSDSLFISNVHIFDVTDTYIYAPTSHAATIRNANILQTIRNKYDATGIDVGGDSVISNCKIWQVLTGIKCGNALVLSGNYLWSGERIDDKKYIAIHASSGTHITASGNYFDSWNTVVKADGANSELAFSGNWLYSQAPNNIPTIIYDLTQGDNRVRSIGNNGYQLVCTDPTKNNYVIERKSIVPRNGYLDTSKFQIDGIARITDMNDGASIMECRTNNTQLIMPFSHTLTTTEKLVIGIVNLYVGESRFIFQDQAGVSIFEINYNNNSLTQVRQNGFDGCKVGLVKNENGNYYIVLSSPSAERIMSTIVAGIVYGYGSNTSFGKPFVLEGDYLPIKEITLGH